MFQRAPFGQEVPLGRVLRQGPVREARHERRLRPGGRGRDTTQAEQADLQVVARQRIAGLTADLQPQRPQRIRSVDGRRAHQQRLGERQHPPVLGMGVACGRQHEPCRPLVPPSILSAQRGGGVRDLEQRDDLERFADFPHPALQAGRALRRLLAAALVKPAQNCGTERDTGRIVGRQRAEQHPRRVRCIGSLVRRDPRVAGQQRAERSLRRMFERREPRMA